MTPAAQSASPPNATTAPGETSPARQGTAALTLAALGVVYGDIGTSPLYTIKEIFAPHTGVPLDALHLVGAISVIFWALMLVVTLKYVILILRADNHGEGGGLALTALAAKAVQHRPALHGGLLLLGMFGATLFYGDSVITPAISVLGAMEGLELVAPSLKPYVVPFTLAILVGLFLIQRRGTAFVGRFFGPIIVLWFVVLGFTGALQIAQQPAILTALNPVHAYEFLASRGWHLFAAVGAIVLAITGAEALYADMGHFGRRPIQLAWTLVVFPGLMLNYLGQGALLMSDPTAIQNPFYRMFPDAWVLPALVLATLAAIIASQAVISGAYSMTKQAILLGFLPRMAVRYTSAREVGQIYMPAVNWVLLAGVVAVVLFFGSSSALASAYGIAVTLTMMIDTVLAFVVVRALWKWNWLQAGLFLAFFVVVDFAFFSANIIKVLDGGWFPLVLGGLIFTFLATWKRGRALLYERLKQDSMPLDAFIQSLAYGGPHRVEGMGVFMTTNPDGVPRAMLHNLLHNKVLHEKVVLLNVRVEDEPHIPEADRVEVRPLPQGFYQVLVRYGFKDEPDIPLALTLCESQGLKYEVMETSFFLGRETIVPRARVARMPRWRQLLFTFMFRNAEPATTFFKIPTNRVVELGTQVEL